MEKKNRYLYYSILPCLLFLIAIGVYVSGYNPPTENPPFGNLPAPINASLEEQTKAGNLIIKGNLITEGILKLGQFAAAPEPAEGALYYNTADKKVKVYSDGEWSDLGGAAGSVTLGTFCTGNYVTVLRLSGTTDAHVEKGTLTNYENPVCLSVSAGNTIICKYVDDCSTLGPDYTCLVSISGETDAHAGDCNAYTTKVCCAVVPE